MTGNEIRRIPVAEPLLGAKEREFVNEALDQGAISGTMGRFLSRFEEEFAAYVDSEIGVTVSTGTAALHLAMAALKVQPGDEILVSTLTNMATHFAVMYQQGTPIPIDIEADTWNLDPKLLAEKVTAKTKGIVVVHLFGHPVDMDPVMDVARTHGLWVVEDCAEAHGATYKGRKVGSIGDIGCFSFYANKIITTGEGGMVVTDSSELAARVRSLKSMSFGAANKFMHDEIGFNYRMTNLQAAVGCGQLERLEEIIASKRRIADFYSSQFSSLDRSLQLPVEREYARSVYWMYHLQLRGAQAETRSSVMEGLAARGVETREGFVPYNMQNFADADVTSCPVANAAAGSSFYIPSGPSLSDDQLAYVASCLKDVLAEG
jgi:perosamine synthetase